MHVHQVEQDKSHHHPLYSLQTQYQLLLTVYFMYTYTTEGVKLNRPHHHPSYSLQTQHQLILTGYFMHAHQVEPDKSHQHPSYSLQHNISIYLPPILYAHIHTQNKLGQTTASASIIFVVNTTSTYTYGLFYARTPS